RARGDAVDRGRAVAAVLVFAAAARAASDRIFSWEWRPYRLPCRATGAFRAGRGWRADAGIPGLWRQIGRAEGNRGLRRWPDRPRFSRPRAGGGEPARPLWRVSGIGRRSPTRRAA